MGASTACCSTCKYISDQRLSGVKGNARQVAITSQASGRFVQQRIVMDPDHIMACQFSAWYPSFSDVAFKSRVIPLPAAFLEFLQQDGVFLPEGSHAVSIACSVSTRMLLVAQRSPGAMQQCPVPLSRCRAALRLCRMRTIRAGRRRTLTQRSQQRQRWCARMFAHFQHACTHACMHVVLAAARCRTHKGPAEPCHGLCARCRSSRS